MFMLMYQHQWLFWIIVDKKGRNDDCGIELCSCLFEEKCALTVCDCVVVFQHTLHRTGQSNLPSRRLSPSDLMSTPLNNNITHFIPQRFWTKEQFNDAYLHQVTVLKPLNSRFLKPISWCHCSIFSTLVFALDSWLQWRCRCHPKNKYCCGHITPDWDLAEEQNSRLNFTACEPAGHLNPVRT